MVKTINGSTVRKMFANAFSMVEENKNDIDANIQKVDVELDGKKGKKNICAKCLKTLNKETK